MEKWALLSCDTTGSGEILVSVNIHTHSSTFGLPSLHRNSVRRCMGTLRVMTSRGKNGLVRREDNPLACIGTDKLKRDTGVNDC